MRCELVADNSLPGKWKTSSASHVRASHWPGFYRLGAGRRISPMKTPKAAAYQWAVGDLGAECWRREPTSSHLLLPWNPPFSGENRRAVAAAAEQVADGIRPPDRPAELRVRQPGPTASRAVPTTSMLIRNDRSTSTNWPTATKRFAIRSRHHQLRRRCGRRYGIAVIATSSTSRVARAFHQRRKDRSRRPRRCSTPSPAPVPEAPRRSAARLDCRAVGTCRGRPLDGR